MTSIKWQLAHGRQLEIGPRALIMGILNVTPDSFSDGGQFLEESAALARADKMIQDGADIIDIGGESTRPGAAPVTPEAEQALVMPAIEVLAALTKTTISIDTYRASTAKAALDSGAHIVNDVWGLRRDPQLAHVIAEAGAGVVIMHTNRERETTLSPLDDQIAYFEESLEIASAAGIAQECIALDPGFGFGKEAIEDNIAVMVGLERLLIFGRPILVGASRKRFLGTLTDRPVGERDVATAASSAILRMKGASIFRVHEVSPNRDALAVADAMLAASEAGV